MNDLRDEINKIDIELLKLIKRRLEIVTQIGKIKKQQNLAVKDPSREKQVIDRLSSLGIEMGINKEVVGKIWRTLFEISYKIEE